MNEDKYTISSGMLKVSGGHTIYYQRWGNEKATPTFFLHGGPGSGSKDKYKSNFDPEKHHIIYHDQRGSGKSLPFGSLDNNTTADLVEDIENLRLKFKFNKINITGGSWGSFLALAYAIKYPDNINRILISGIYTGTKTENDYIAQGGLKTHFPDSWNQYIELVPEEARANTTKYYYDKFLNGSPEEQTEHVKRWCLLEGSAMSIDNDYNSLVISSSGFDESTKVLAILEAHYFLNKCFVEDNFIINNSDILSKIDITMVHGRFDHVCPPTSAYNLAKAIGKNCHLQIVPAGHSNEHALRETVRAYCWTLLA